MAETKKRMAMGLGITMHMQTIDEQSDVIVMENFVNNWGGRFSRLDIDEAILFQAALLKECKSEYQALESKAMDVASAFGLELVGETSSKKTNPAR